jgi:hypothetical protein
MKVALTREPEPIEWDEDQMDTAVPAPAEVDPDEVRAH